MKNFLSLFFVMFLIFPTFAKSTNPYTDTVYTWDVKIAGDLILEIFQNHCNVNKEQLEPMINLLKESPSRTFIDFYQSCAFSQDLILGPRDENSQCEGKNNGDGCVYFFTEMIKRQNQMHGKSYNIGRTQTNSIVTGDFKGDETISKQIIISDDTSSASVVIEEGVTRTDINDNITMIEGYKNIDDKKDETLEIVVDGRSIDLTDEYNHYITPTNKESKKYNKESKKLMEELGVEYEDDKNLGKIYDMSSSEKGRAIYEHSADFFEHRLEPMEEKLKEEGLSEKDIEDVKNRVQNKDKDGNVKLYDGSIKMGHHKSHIIESSSQLIIENDNGEIE